MMFVCHTKLKYIMITTTGKMIILVTIFTMLIVNDGVATLSWF